ncbi:MAG: hypothetical protein LJE75_10310 [Gammaproteobacteria bacterium]|jgi:hypothetical protein|nr:hypothetical protein [Gammaproteobacteria bacterium]
MSATTWITTLFKTTCVIAAITLLLFIAVNIGAQLYLEHHPLSVSDARYFLDEESAEGIAIRKRIFNTNDEHLLEAYVSAPGIRPHTVLHFTEGAARPYYKVGLEGIRYLSGWSDKFVQNLLTQQYVQTFVFGGSTTFGDGVPDNSTVVARLDAIDEEKTYINFGTQAYDSIREVDKLVYLLRKGYRPKSVIFIDGLNEVTTFARSPYELHDSPRAQGLILDRGQVPLVFGVPVNKNRLLALAYSFPVSHLIYRFLNRMHDADDGFIRKSANVDGLDNWFELMDFHYNWASLHKNRIDELANEIIQYYKENISFVRQLGDSFGFDAHFIYQPIGLLEPNQEFLLPDFYASDYFAVYSGVDSRIRQAISQGFLMMEDCSRAISEAGLQGSYVDATHYSPQGNDILASCIFQKISAP